MSTSSTLPPDGKRGPLATRAARAEATDVGPLDFRGETGGANARRFAAGGKPADRYANVAGEDPTLTGTTARPVVRARPKGIRHPLRLPILLYVLTLALVVLHQGRLVELFYPAGVIGIAALFYRRSSAHYVSFVIWTFLLSPEVRRLADYVNGGFNPQSLIMVAPLAAVALTGFTLLRNMKLLGQRRAMPIVLIIIAMFYAFIVGMVQVGPAAALFTLINWIFPVLVSFHLVATWRDYPVYHRVLLKTFVWGGFAIGLYGVIEYISPPPWDAFWLIASQMTSEGSPVPFGMRVSSTLNSSGPFAMAIMSVMLLSFGSRSKMRLLMAAVGIPALMFTAVRSAWGGFAIGLIYPLLMLDGKSRLKLIGGLLVFAALAAPLMMIDQVSEPILKRFDTMQNIGKDNSYQVRSEFYRQFFATAISDIAGQGLGTTGVGSKLNANNTQQVSVVFDSGVMEVPYVLGWPGTLLWTAGIGMMLWRAFAASRVRSKDRLTVACVGVSIAIFAMMLFVNTLTGLPGMFFFVGVTLPVVGLRFARHSRAARDLRGAMAVEARSTMRSTSRTLARSRV